MSSVVGTCSIPHQRIALMVSYFSPLDTSSIHRQRCSLNRGSISILSSSRDHSTPTNSYCICSHANITIANNSTVHFIPELPRTNAVMAIHVRHHKVGSAFAAGSRQRVRRRAPTCCSARLGGIAKSTCAHHVCRWGERRPTPRLSRHVP